MRWREFHNAYGEIIQKKAYKYKVDPGLLAGLIKQESNGNPNAVSSCGARGLTQGMPDTIRDMNADISTIDGQIDFGAKYLAWIDTHFSRGNTIHLLAGYNAGIGTIKNDKWIDFKETRDYVPRVLRYANEYRKYTFRGLLKERFPEKYK